MHRAMKSGICALTIALISASSLGQDDPRVAFSNDIRLEVVPVRYAPAEHVSITLKNVIRTIHVTPDNRTNSLIVAGTSDEIETAKQLLASLDVRVDEERMELPERTGKQVRAYGVEHAEVDQQFLGTLSTLLRTTETERTQLHLALDSRQNQVIASGQPEYLSAVATLVDMLDQPVESRLTTTTQASGELSVRLLWLVGGNSDDSRSVPNDVQPVVDELSRYGVQDLKLGAQAIIRVSANDDFRTSFASTVDAHWMHEVNGRIHSTAEGRLRLEIDVEGMSAPDSRPGSGQSRPSRDVIHFQTAIHTTAGQFVVLSMNPVANMDSVYVLQINSVD